MSRAAARLEKIAIETFSVVLGIVLAFGANAWHDRRVHEQSACEALRAIRTELASNDSVVHAKLPYHEAMNDSLIALVGRTHGAVVPNGLRAIANWSGLSPAQLLDDAWQTARSTQGVQYLPYDVAIQLSRAYAAQQRISDQSRGFYAAVYTPAFATGGVSAIAAMQSFLSDLKSNEEHLESQLDTTLARIRNRCPAR